MTPTTQYLILYNLISCLGWGLIWYHVAFTFFSGGNAESLWLRCGNDLVILQTLAILEIVHSLVRIVKSPPLTVMLQVGSRLVVLYGFVRPAPMCRKHWSLLVLLGSWSTVEVPRYLYYMLNLIPSFSGVNMPYSLFWLRYSLFIVLYPSGITAELLQIYIALVSYYTYETAFERLLYVVPLWAYIPLGPFMVYNMWYNRTSQFKKRRAELAGPKPLNGIVWPVTNTATGDRSTSETNQAVWAASLARVAPEAAAAVRKSRGWRFSYKKHVRTHVEVCLQSPDNALNAATDGLKYMRDAFEFVRNGESMPFSNALEFFKDTFHTGFIEGTGKIKVDGCQITYKGKVLKGKSLKTQVDKWVANGTMEPSAATSIKAVIDNPSWVNLSDKYFVLLGATSAMGPLDLLLECGANVVGIDINRSPVWKKLIEKVRCSPGTLTFPLSKPQNVINDDNELYNCAGCDLLAQTPEIANWVSTVCPGKQLTIGNYTYLDGALHVQLSVACDAIIESLCQKRADTSVAFLCTPTDCHPILSDAYECASVNYRTRPDWQRFVEPIFGLRRNICPPARKMGLFFADCISVDQGPNYILAKRAQAWRAVLAYNAGHIVSSNVAPSTSTASVTSNRLFAAAYEGFVLFKSLEVMDPETSSPAMLALLINDIRNPLSAANPQTTKLANPLQLMAYNAFHGGSFRAPYQIGSIGVVCVLYSFLTKFWMVWSVIIILIGYSVAFVAGTSTSHKHQH